MRDAPLVTRKYSEIRNFGFSLQVSINVQDRISSQDYQQIIFHINFRDPSSRTSDQQSEEDGEDEDCRDDLLDVMKTVVTSTTPY